MERRDAYRGWAVTVILTKEQLLLNRKNRDVTQVLALGRRETQREKRSGSKRLDFKVNQSKVTLLGYELT